MCEPFVFGAEARDELVGGDQSPLHELGLLLQQLLFPHGRLVLLPQSAQLLLDGCQLVLDPLQLTLTLEEVSLQSCYL